MTRRPPMLHATLCAALTAGAAFLAGCGDTITDENYAKISNDMSRAQVEKIMGGEGDDQTTSGVGISSAGIASGSDDTTKTFSWKSGDKMIIVDFKGGKVVNKSKRGF